MGTVVEEYNELKGKGKKLGEMSKMHAMQCSLLRHRRLDFLKWRIESDEALHQYRR